MKGRWFAILCCCSVIVNSVIAQQVQYTVIASKHQVLIGEPFKLQLTATTPQLSNIHWLTIDSIEHFEIMNRSKVDTQLTTTAVTLKQVYTITSWDSGQWQLPSFHLAYSNRTAPISIAVTYTPFDAKQDYHDVKNIIEVKRPPRTTWYWYAIGVALLLFLFWLLFPQRKQSPQPAPPISGEEAYKEAMQRLSQLKNSSQPEEVKAYYTSLITIFRDYLYKRKGIPSFSKTTEDLTLPLKALQLPATDFTTLVNTLQLSDMVKFAKYQPLPEENKTAWEVIKNSITTIENKK